LYPQFLFIYLYMDNLLNTYKTIGLDTYTNYELRQIAKSCLEFCSKTMGINRRKKTPIKIRIIKNPYKSPRAGDYCPTDNEIRIFYNELHVLQEFVDTIIHEYTHHLQPILTKYDKLLDEFGYDDHPHELEAYTNETIYSDPCILYLIKNCNVI